MAAGSIADNFRIHVQNHLKRIAVFRHIKFGEWNRYVTVISPHRCYLEEISQNLYSLRGSWYLVCTQCRNLKFTGNTLATYRLHGTFQLNQRRQTDSQTLQGTGLCYRDLSVNRLNRYRGTVCHLQGKIHRGNGLSIRGRHGYSYTVSFHWSGRLPAYLSAPAVDCHSCRPAHEVVHQISGTGVTGWQADGGHHFRKQGCCKFRGGKKRCFTGISLDVPLQIIWIKRISSILLDSERIRTCYGTLCVNGSKEKVAI